MTKIATTTKKIVTPEQKLRNKVKELTRQLEYTTNRRDYFQSEYNSAAREVKQLQEVEQTRVMSARRREDGEIQSLKDQVTMLQDIIRWQINPETAKKPESYQVTTSPDQFRDYR